MSRARKSMTPPPIVLLRHFGEQLDNTQYLVALGLKDVTAEIVAAGIRVRALRAGLERSRTVPWAVIEMAVVDPFGPLLSDLANQLREEERRVKP